jgi:hypothetical protein
LSSPTKFGFGLTPFQSVKLIQIDWTAGPTRNAT